MFDDGSVGTPSVGWRRAAGRLTGRRTSWVVIAVAVLLSGVLLGLGVSADQADGGGTDLPDDAESARAAALIEALAPDQPAPVVVVYDHPGRALSPAERAYVDHAAAGLAEAVAGAGGAAGARTGGADVPPTVSDDGQAAVVVVPVAGDLSDAEQTDVVQALRDRAGAGLPPGLRAQVTGGPAFSADLSAVFDGADSLLLVVTASVVAVLLLVTYRSPWLWLVPLLVVGLADRLTVTVVAIATHPLSFQADGASTGITSVLVFGAGTNYALLLIARYREELRRCEDRYEAMRHAWGRAAPAIVASSGTVILALLCLALAESPGNRSIGIGGALGIATAVISVLLVLPAALTVFGRGLFWPLVPRLGQDEPTLSGVWARVARFVTGRPAAVAGAGLVVLVALAAPLVGVRSGLSQTEQFTARPESVTGQEVVAAHFPAGSSEPTQVVAPAAAADRLVRDLGRVRGVRDVRPESPAEGASDGTRDGTRNGNRDGNRDAVVLDVVLDAAPASDAAFDTVRGVRRAALAVDPEVVVGGPDAEALDASDAAARDRRLVIPLVLGVVALVLLLLLRSVVAAVVLIATVVATYVASLGASWALFTTVFDFPALDTPVPLLAFLFLVALGVDYNIFLATRAREEAEGSDTVTAISVALAVTGGVITSAGILLAAVFTVLGVLPIITLTQVGVVVGLGVLLDTLLVRSVLVPALVALLGPRFWWPSDPTGRGPRTSGPRGAVGRPGV